MPAYRLSKEVMIALRLQLVEGLILLQGGSLQRQTWTPLQTRENICNATVISQSLCHSHDRVKQAHQMMTHWDEWNLTFKLPVLGLERTFSSEGPADSKSCLGWGSDIRLNLRACPSCPDSNVKGIASHLEMEHVFLVFSPKPA